MEREKFLLVLLMLFGILSLFIFIPRPYTAGIRIGIAPIYDEVKVKVPGLESAYHWVKKLTSMGYAVEIVSINEPGYPFEVRGTRARI